MKLVITCEHAEGFVPDKYSALFDSDPEVLATHEAYDPGAFDLFETLKPLADFHEHQKISRLLIETNRSAWHNSLFSRFSKVLDKKEKQELLSTWYYPYRNGVEEAMYAFLQEKQPVIHLSIHSFTPVLREQLRNCDIGLLYDPQKKNEKQFCRSLKDRLINLEPRWKIRYNYPYRGAADGFTTHLRKRFGESYMGIEIEINQKWVREGKIPEEMKEGFYEVVKSLKSKKAP